MKSSLSPAILLISLFVGNWTSQVAAQELSEDGILEVSLGQRFYAPSDDSGWDGKHPSDCVCCCGPTWSFAADAVFMQRSRPDSLVLMQDAADPTRNLDADSLGFDFAAGWDVSVRRETSVGSLEARLLSIDGWDAANTVMVGAPTLVRINTFVPFFLPGVTSVAATYNSELLSGELNFRRQLFDDVAVLGGFRYLELDEHFHTTLNAAVLPSTYDTLTRNRLYGAQVGVDATLWCRDRLTVGGLAKFGVFHNSSGQNTVLDTGIVVVTAADASNRAAFLGEFAFTADYCLTDSLTLRAGYDLLWLETVALASDQVPATNFFTSTGIAADGGAFYHGAFVGLEFRR